ncbi:hypothetical protein GTY54_34585 [Streptomyces sp. SID625]|nr:hypothetical protein [Streptomyces sp. SID625]
MSAPILNGRTVASPAAVAALATCKQAKDAAYTASIETAGMPSSPTIEAAQGVVKFVVHPRTLADWAQWKHVLGVERVHGSSTGTSMVVPFWYGGVRARLVGVGVPALYSEMRAGQGARS